MQIRVRYSHVSSAGVLKALLCRFIHAPHSREKLRISKSMMMQILTYHEVMPAYLSQLSPFGRQHYQQDFHYGGFQSASRIETTDGTVSIPELGRSGRQLEFCLNLKSVERTTDSHRPWSTRQCSIYHQFDLLSQRAVWIVVKGNDYMRNLISTRLRARQIYSHEPHGSVSGDLEFSLWLHLEFVKWSVENWHWYISSLEQSLQDKTRSMTSAPVSDASMLDQSYEERLAPVFPARAQGTRGDMWRTFLRPSKTGTMASWTSSRQTNIQGSWTADEEKTLNVAAPRPAVQQAPVSFEGLQHLHFLEEKANDTALNVQSNTQVLRRLKQEYVNLFDSQDCLPDIAEEARTGMDRFQRTIDSTCSEFAMIEARLRSLISLIENRKALVGLRIVVDLSR
jgi:hypothetical protein